jgi:UDP-N-acetylmuramyl pentapeptide phosphotransferase/UDP-N-acetylglucosamine-1-phosphate transferase
MTIFAALSFLFSFALCATVVLTKSWHLHLTSKGHTASAKQSSHRIPTPRIGGLGLLAFAITGALMSDAETARLILLLSVSAIPVFLGGFGEDTGFDVTPKMRLLLSFLSAAIAGVLLSAWVSRSGIPGLDSALSITLVSIAFTMLMSGGICHAINLVDGLNGLSIGLSLMMAGALATISMLVGDSAMTSVSLVLIAAMAGIFVFNFPLGKIFLGDAGAYSIGHLLTWIAILLMARNPEVAPFAMFLIFFWPVADMLFAIMRRLRNGKPIDQPDRMHFHQFVMRAIELTVVSRRSVSNPLAAAMIWPLAAFPISFAILFYNANLVAAIAWLVCFGLFVWSYVAGIRIACYLSRARKDNEKLTATIGREGFGRLKNVAAKGSRIHPAE